MEQYKKHNSGDTGVEFYEIEDNALIVQFVHGGKYKYSYESAGKENVEEMKRLAMQGKGLSTFINQHVKEMYESYWPASTL